MNNYLVYFSLIIGLLFLYPDKDRLNIEETKDLILKNQFIFSHLHPVFFLHSLKSLIFLRKFHIFSFKNSAR